MLLKNEESHGEHCPQQVDPRLKPRTGECKQFGIETYLKFLPNKVTPFISRNQDMFDVLRLLTQNNIV